jgi:hypothetical protein
MPASVDGSTARRELKDVPRPRPNRRERAESFHEAPGRRVESFQEAAGRRAVCRWPLDVPRWASTAEGAATPAVTTAVAVSARAVSRVRKIILHSK